MPFEFTIPGVAIDERILTGQPLTGLEAILYFGFADVATRVTRLRRQGFQVGSRQVPLKDVLDRIEATLGAPVPIGALARLRFTGMADGGCNGSHGSGKEEIKPAYLTEYFVAEGSRTVRRQKMRSTGPAASQDAV